MTKPKPTGNPHPFIPDPDVPPGMDGRGACATCHLVGQPDDSHHRMPDLFDADEAHRRRIGEREEVGRMGEG